LTGTKVKSNGTGLAVVSVGSELGGSGAGITNGGDLEFELIKMTFGTTLGSGVTPLISSTGTGLGLNSSVLCQTGTSGIRSGLGKVKSFREDGCV
jgi:hypothetical protein